MLSYHRETALQDGLVMAKSGRLELGDNILWPSNRWKNAKWGLLRRSRSSRSVSIESPYATSC